jgi:hypothetical protein
MNEKIISHGIDALARSGTRAIGSFVRAWLCTLGCIVVLWTGACVVQAISGYDPYHYGPGLTIALGFGFGCWLAFMAAVPAAIVVAVVYVAVKF